MSRYGQSPSPALRGRLPRSAFTLIEILAVLVLVGLVLGLSVGRISSIIARERLNRAAFALSTDLQTAFTLAQRDRKPVKISYDATAVQIIVSDAATGDVFSKIALANFGLTPSNISANRSSLIVYPAGLADDSLSVTLSMTIGDTTYTHRVRMTRGGLVQVK